MNRIGIVGAGAWGTALANVARGAGRDVVMWSYDAEAAEAINRNHENTLFLPGVAVDPAIRATTDMAEAVDADAVLLVVPAQHMRTICRAAAAAWRPGVAAVICAKGVEQDTCALMSEVVAEELPDAVPAVLSGPSFAIEVARGLPTAVTLACRDLSLARTLVHALGVPRFRIYEAEDVVGAQIGGAVKNVLAIACGIVQGRGLGDNARAALITRGLVEIARLGAAKGGHPETVMGLTGLGDLVLTCNAMQSRNFSFGVALGEGRTVDDILAARTGVTEGVSSASAVTDLARKLDVDMPICLATDGVLNHHADIDATIQGLLARPVGVEDPMGRGG